LIESKNVIINLLSGREEKKGLVIKFDGQSTEVTSKGVEPITYGSGNRHSIQLSYEANILYKVNII
jgi:hypothetical protein